MALKNLLETLAIRAPWQAVGRRILKRSGYTVHRGTQPTIDAILASAADANRVDRLEKALVEHALAGEKLVCLVRITDAERRTLLSWIRGKRRPAGDLTSPFPSVASAALIRANHLSDPASLGNEELEDGAAAFFTAVRSFMDRVEVPLTDLKASANDGYEQIFAVKNVMTQRFLRRSGR